jgi:hypothetical protein
MSEHGKEEQGVGASDCRDGFTNATAPAVVFGEPSATLASQNGSAVSTSVRLDGFTNTTAPAVVFGEPSVPLASPADRDGGRMVADVVSNIGALSLAQRHALMKALLGGSGTPAAAADGPVAEQCGGEPIGGLGADTDNDNNPLGYGRSSVAAQYPGGVRTRSATRRSGEALSGGLEHRSRSRRSGEDVVGGGSATDHPIINLEEVQQLRDTEGPAGRRAILRTISERSSAERNASGLGVAALRRAEDSVGVFASREAEVYSAIDAARVAGDSDALVAASVELQARIAATLKAREQLRQMQRLAAPTGVGGAVGAEGAGAGRMSRVVKFPVTEVEAFVGQRGRTDPLRTYEFLELVHAGCRRNGCVTEGDRIRQFERSLRGEAATWFNTWRKGSDQCSAVPLTLDMVAAAFFSAFTGPRAYYDVLELFNKARRQADESIYNFVDRLGVLADLLGTCRTSKAYRYGVWGGITDDMRHKLSYSGLGPDKPLEAILSRVAEIEAEQRATKAASGGDRSRLSPTQILQCERVAYGQMGGGEQQFGGDPEAAYDWEETSPEEIQLFGYLKHEAGRGALVALMQPSPHSREGPPAYSLPTAVTCYHCEGMGHYARECTSSVKCYICGAPHNKLACPWYNKSRSSVWCTYCTRKGHIDTGCSRKARGLAPVPHAGPGKDKQVQAMERTLAQNLGRATKPYPTSTPLVPALDDIRRMVTSAAGQLDPRQRRAFFGSLAAMMEQDALHPAADFRERA